MTVSSTDSRKEYNGNDTTTAFSFPYLFYDEDHLQVYLVDSSGTSTLQTITTDYTVTGVGDDAGGTVTMVTPPATGETLIILRVVPLKQEIDYINGGAFPSDSHEQGLDLGVMIAQQQQDDIDRSLKAPASDASASQAYDADGLKIESMAQGTADSDAVTKAQAEAIAASAGSGVTPDSLVQNVDTLSDLQAVVTGSFTGGELRYLKADSRSGMFKWDASDLSTEVGNDEVTAGEGDGFLYIAPGSDKTGSSGAWVKQTPQYLDDIPAADYARTDIDETFAGNVAGQNANFTNLPGRNKIINGNFDIWQRGTSQTSNGYGSDDRWKNGHVGSSKTHSQQAFTLGQTDVPGEPRYYSRTVVTSSAGASSYVNKQQSIEDVRTFAGQTVTLSFKAKADVAKNIAVDLQQYFGTGGSPSTSVTGIGAQLVALTASWQKFEVEIAIPSISGKTIGSDNNDWLGLFFWFDAGSIFDARTASLGQQSGTFDIAQVQLEKGDLATPFEERLPGVELTLCQRYYEKSYNVDVDPGTFTSEGRLFRRAYTTASIAHTIPVRFAVTKRAVPTVTIYTTEGTAGQMGIGGSTPSATAFSIGETAFYGEATAAAGSDGDEVDFHFTADAEL